MTRIPHGGGALLAVVLASACATLGLQRFQEPTIELERLFLRDLTVSGGIIDVVVRVHNPNGFTIRATTLELDLDVAGSPVGRVRYDRRFDLPTRESSTLILPLEFSWGGVGTALQSAISSGEVGYRVTGHVRVRASGEEHRVPFSRGGGIRLLAASEQAMGVFPSAESRH